jgi:hypothetical protein
MGCPAQADEQDGLHVEVLDLRAHVWGVEQDLTKIVKNGTSALKLRQRGDEQEGKGSERTA